MIRVEATSDFTLRDFDKIKDIKRKSIDIKGKIFNEDTFVCDDEMYNYLNGGNKEGYIVVKVIEIVPEEEKIEINKVIKSAKDDKEYVKPLKTKNGLEKIAEELIKQVEVKPRKRRTSKKGE